LTGPSAFGGGSVCRKVELSVATTTNSPAFKTEPTTRITSPTAKLVKILAAA
jgi:hypothetical protein